jgi:hypothetical protein
MPINTFIVSYISPDSPPPLGPEPPFKNIVQPDKFDPSHHIELNGAGPKSPGLNGATPEGNSNAAVERALSRTLSIEDKLPPGIFQNNE